MPSDTTPLPVAANRAEISNRISLLLNKQSSILKTLNPSKPSDQSRRRKPQPTHDDRDPDEDLFKGSRPNEGVGYERPKEGPDAGDKSKEDMTLRRRLMRRKEGANAIAQRLAKKQQPESESDDDAGRSALGKRKRPKRAADVDPVQAEAVSTTHEGTDLTVHQLQDGPSLKADAQVDASSTGKQKKKKKKGTKGEQ